MRKLTTMNWDVKPSPLLIVSPRLCAPRKWNKYTGPECERSYQAKTSTHPLLTPVALQLATSNILQPKLYQPAFLNLKSDGKLPAEWNFGGKLAMKASLYGQCALIQRLKSRKICKSHHCFAQITYKKLLRLWRATFTQDSPNDNAKFSLSGSPQTDYNVIRVK